MKQKLQKLVLAGSSAAAGLQLAAGTAMAQVGEVRKPGGFFEDIGTVVSRALTFVLVLAALLVFMYLIWGGIEWITSGGDKGKTENARNKITAAVIGLIVVAAAYAVLQLALTFLGVGDLNALLGTIAPTE